MEEVYRPKHNPWIIAVTVTLATIMEVLDTSIANVALPHIAGSLGVSQDESTWVLTSYLVANAIVLPIGAYMGSIIGRKKFYMTCVAIFGVSSLLCGLAPSLPLLLLFRVIQGLGGGGLQPSEQSILADTFPPEKRGQAFAVYGLAVVTAPIVGPTLGGWITDNYDWRWIFFINIPIAILSLFLTHRLVEDTPKIKREVEDAKRGGFRLDMIGFGLIALTFGSLEVVLDKGQEDDWFGSNFIVAFTMLAVIGLIALIVWELRQAQGKNRPVLDLKLFASRNFPDLQSRWTIPHHVRFHRNGTRAVLHDQPRPTDELRVRCQAALSSIDRFSLPICANQHSDLCGRSSRQEQRRFRTFESCTQCRWLCRNILLYDGAGTSSAGAPAIFGAACASW